MYYIYLLKNLFNQELYKQHGNSLRELKKRALLNNDKPSTKLVLGKNGAGFTLIELLVTIAIIGILAVTAMTMINPAKQSQRARDSKRKADLAQMQAAFELYRSDQGVYPGSQTCGSALAFGGTTYLKSIPCDPKNPTQVYTYNPSASPVVTYTLVACLENASDTQKDAVNIAPCTGIAGTVSYTLTNP